MKYPAPIYLSASPKGFTVFSMKHHVLIQAGWSGPGHQTGQILDFSSGILSVLIGERMQGETPLGAALRKAIHEGKSGREIRSIQPDMILPISGLPGKKGTPWTVANLETGLACSGFWEEPELMWRGRLRKHEGGFLHAREGNPVLLAEEGQKEPRCIELPPQAFREPVSLTEEIQTASEIMDLGASRAESVVASEQTAMRIIQRAEAGSEASELADGLGEILSGQRRLIAMAGKDGRTIEKIIRIRGIVGPGEMEMSVEKKETIH